MATMATTKSKDREFTSYDEYLKHYYPQSEEEVDEQKMRDPRSLGISIARESLKKVQLQTVRK